MNMAGDGSFALFQAGYKGYRTWPVTDADNRQGGAASFETKVMVKLKQSGTLETGSQREQMLSTRHFLGPSQATKAWLLLWYCFMKHES